MPRRIGPLLCALTAAALLAGCAAPGEPVDAVAAPAVSGAPSVSPAPLVPAASAATKVLRDGDRATASGRVVSVPGRPVRLCAREFELHGYVSTEAEPAPDWCGRGIDVTGVAMDGLADRREKAGAVEGYATLTGTLTGEVLAVEQQQAPSRKGQTQEPFEPSAVPCPAPEGGWPRDPSILRGPGYEPEGDANMLVEQPALDAHRKAHPEQFVDLGYLRPFDDSVLLGVVTPDESSRQAVESALRPAYGVQLCVVVSRYTSAEIAAADAARNLDGAIWSTGQVFTSGRNVTDDLQVQFPVEVVRLTDQLLTLASEHPAGLIDVQPWLTPAP